MAGLGVILTSFNIYFCSDDHVGVSYVYCAGQEMYFTVHFHSKLRIKTGSKDDLSLTINYRSYFFPK